MMQDNGVWHVAPISIVLCFLVVFIIFFSMLSVTNKKTGRTRWSSLSLAAITRVRLNRRQQSACVNLQAQHFPASSHQIESVIQRAPDSHGHE